MISAIVVAAGAGKRMKSKTSKPFLSLAGKPLLLWTLENISASKVDNLIVVAAPTEVNRITNLICEYSIKKVKAVGRGGEHRQDSVANALALLPENTQIVAIHDGARPLVSVSLINKIIDELGDFDGIIPAVVPADTIKQSGGGFVEKTLNRQHLRAVQTPQVFKKEPLLKSYAKAKEEGFYGTDDASLLEKYGYKVKITEGSYDNIKVTTPVDLALAEVLIKGEL